MATLARAAVTLTPALVIPIRLTRAGRSVVHEILNDPEPDVTSREPASRAGDLRLIFPDAATAAAAQAALSTVGGPWTLAGADDDLDGTWKVTGDVSYEPSADGMRSRIITVTVREVTP